MYRKTIRDIIKKAGVTPWPKLFRNLRSTRETELFQITNGNIKAVCNWMGDSPQVAVKHYAQVTDEDFAAVLGGGTESGTPVAQNAAQQSPASIRKELNEIDEKAGIVNIFGPICDLLQKEAADCDVQSAASAGPYWTRTSDLAGVIRTL